MSTTPNECKVYSKRIYSPPKRVDDKNLSTTFITRKISKDMMLSCGG